MTRIIAGASGRAGSVYNLPGGPFNNAKKVGRRDNIPS